MELPVNQKAKAKNDILSLNRRFKNPWVLRTTFPFKKGTWMGWLVFLLLVPTQLGRHFWFDWSKIWGIRVDYLVPTLYLSDVVWLFLLINPRVLRTTFPLKKGTLIKVMVVGVGILGNILLATNPWVAGYRWLRIFQWLITIQLIKLESYKVRKLLVWIIPAWIVVEAMLGLAQVINGGSIGGIWWWFGERTFNLGTIGIAQMAINGESLLRAYGTFSHPNSLAGFLLVAMLMLKRIWNLESGRKKIIYWTSMWMGVLGILITGSRTVWAVGVIVLIVSCQLQIKSWKKRIGIMLVVAGIAIMGASRLGGWDAESWPKRVKLLEAAGEMVRDYPLFGVGAGNFVVKLPEYWQGKNWLQPVHNIFLLATSEIGIVGWVVVLYVFFPFKKGTWVKMFLKNWEIILAVVITGMLDHYWLTLPQNTWLLAIVGGWWGKIGRVEKTNH